MFSLFSSFSGSISDPECPMSTALFDYEHLPLRFSSCSEGLSSRCISPHLEAEERALGLERAHRCPVCSSGEDRKDTEDPQIRCSECRESQSSLHLVCSYEGCDRAGLPLCYGCATTSHRGHDCQTNENVQAEKKIYRMFHIPIESLHRFVDEETLKLHIRERLLDLMDEFKYKNTRRLADSLLTMTKEDLISMLNNPGYFHHKVAQAESRLMDTN